MYLVLQSIPIQGKHSLYSKHCTIIYYNQKFTDDIEKNKNKKRHIPALASIYYKIPDLLNIIKVSRYRTLVAGLCVSLIF